MRVADPPIVSPIDPIENAVDDERFRGLADELPQPMVCLDSGGAAAWVNRAFVGFTGLSREELNAGGWRALLHPDERDRSARRFLDGLRGNAPFEAEWRVRRAGDGSFRWVLVRSWPLAREHARWCCIATDVHEATRARRAAELAVAAGSILAASFDHATTVANLARIAVPRLGDFGAVALRDASGKLTFPSVSHVDPTQVALVRRATPPYRPRAGDPLAEVIESGVPALWRNIREEELASLAHHPAQLAAFQRLLPRSIAIGPLVAGGRSIGALIVGTSTSSRVISDDDLDLLHALIAVAAPAIDNAARFSAAERAVAAREELLAVVAHDLRNLLASIVAGTGNLLRRAPPSEETRSTRLQLTAIDRSAARMHRLLRDLLDAASLDAGRLPIELREHDAAALAADAVESTQPQARARGIRLELLAPTATGNVRCDASRIHQVLANLLGNALKFTPTGSVTVAVERGEREMIFAVRDAGPGIPSQEIGRLFARYFTARRGGAVGTGLGLYIARGIVQAHRGRLWVESEVGAGSTFYFTLPIC